MWKHLFLCTLFSTGDPFCHSPHFTYLNVAFQSFTYTSFSFRLFKQGQLHLSKNWKPESSSEYRHVWTQSITKKLLCKTCSIKEVNFIFFTLVGHRLSNIIHTLVVQWFPMVFHGISHNSLVFSCYYTYISVTELSYTLPEKICWPTQCSILYAQPLMLRMCMIPLSIDYWLSNVVPNEKMILT